jgi:hypothetical protein
VSHYGKENFWKYFEALATIPSGAEKARYEYAVAKTASILTDVRI